MEKSLTFYIFTRLPNDLHTTLRFKMTMLKTIVPANFDSGRSRENITIIIIF